MNKKIFLIITLLLSGYLLWHNVRLYNPVNGFDASGHMAYINIILKEHRLPLPHQGWEMNQPPLYYLLASLFTLLNVSPQIIGLILFIALALFIYRFTHSSLSVFAFCALPMAVYLVPLISNEYLSGFFGVPLLLMLLKIAGNNSTSNKELLFLVIIFILAFYTKVTALMFLPLIPLSLFLQKDSHWFQKSMMITMLCAFIASPLMVRNFLSYGKPLVINDDFFEFTGTKEKRDLAFFFSPAWISSPDLYNAHDYSFAGGLWNTFWHDGEHVTTPVVEFHKKPFLLWLLGFPLFGLSVYGLYRFFKRQKKQGIVLISFLGLSLAVLVAYNFRLPYNNVLKTFFVFPVMIPYVIGLTETGRNKKMGALIWLLLIAQYLLMYSWFYIQPWWYVAK